MSTPEPQSLVAALGLSDELDTITQDTLRNELKAILNRTAQLWPEIRAGKLLAYIGEKLAETGHGEAPVLERLAALPLDEIILAYCCATGDSKAILAFENDHFGVIAPALRRLGLQSFEDEVSQRVRDQLFVAGAGALPRVAALAGNGSLSALVRVIATRTALNLKRRDAKLAPDGDEQIANAMAMQECPGVQTAKAQQREIFKAAFQTALGTLDVRSRSVLRMHLLHSMNISEIAELFDVHRATTARWLGQIRDDLGRETRRILREQLQLASSELESLMNVAQSKIEISFERLLES